MNILHKAATWHQYQCPVNQKITNRFISGNSQYNDEFSQEEKALLTPLLTDAALLENWRHLMLELDIVEPTIFRPPHNSMSVLWMLTREIVRRYDNVVYSKPKS